MVGLQKNFFDKNQKMGTKIEAHKILKKQTTQNKSELVKILIDRDFKKEVMHTNLLTYFFPEKTWRMVEKPIIVPKKSLEKNRTLLGRKISTF